MSKETADWLNQYTLQSRAVWHTDEQLQKLYNTIYNGPIPVQDVLDRLFGWNAIEAEVKATCSILTADGVEYIEICDEDRKAILRPPGALGKDDPGAIMGIFKKGYQGHSYAEWLVGNVATILDDDLGIYSAGLLKGGAQAWVQVSVPDTIETPEGVVFRPNLLAVTSFDGSLATTYKRTVTNTVCDNTMGAALSENGETFKVKHSRYSNMKIMEARDALALVHTIADDFAAEVAELSAVKVSAGDWEKFLNEIAPLTNEDGTAKEGRGATMAQNKHDEMNRLWNHDERVAPWKGTAYGVVQAVNTHAHHIQTVRGSEREERNMTLAVTGGFDKIDSTTREQIMAIVG